MYNVKLRSCFHKGDLVGCPPPNPILTGMKLNSKSYSSSLIKDICIAEI